MCLFASVSDDWKGVDTREHDEMILCAKRFKCHALIVATGQYGQHKSIACVTTTSNAWRLHSLFISIHSPYWNVLCMSQNRKRITENINPIHSQIDLISYSLDLEPTAIRYRPFAVWTYNEQVVCVTLWEHLEPKNKKLKIFW